MQLLLHIHIVSQHENALRLVFGGSRGDNIVFLPADQSPTGNPALLVANELSGTTNLWDIAVAAPSVRLTSHGCSRRDKRGHAPCPMPRLLRTLRFEEYGYFAVLLLMGAIAGGALLFMRLKRWL